MIYDLSYVKSAVKPQPTNQISRKQCCLLEKYLSCELTEFNFSRSQTTMAKAFSRTVGDSDSLYFIFLVLLSSS